jgi:hypothetical protein
MRYLEARKSPSITKEEAFKVDFRRQGDYDHAMELGDIKLTGIGKKPKAGEGKNRAIVSFDAQYAVVELRVQLSTDVGRAAGVAMYNRLVSSHMRVAYSMLQNRTVMRSGYPSEPLLAEVAAQRLHGWRLWERDAKKLEKNERGMIDPAIDIIAKALVGDLIAPGEIGEVTARLLLLLARDEASVLESGGGNTMREHKDGRKGEKGEIKMIQFCKAVPLITFLKLLLKDVAAEALLAQEVNVRGESKTLAEALKNSVVNFTHFTRWGLSKMNVEASYLCFLRHAGIICRLNFKDVDFVIPVLLNAQEPMSPGNMTAIFVQARRRVYETSLARAAMNPAAFPHPSNSEDTYDFFEGFGPPYIEMTMDLGVTVGVNGPSFVVPTPPSRSSTRTRISPPNRNSGIIIVRGCDRRAYGVIQTENEEEKFGTILRTDGLFTHHPRQRREKLEEMCRQLPVCEIDTLQANFDNLGTNPNGSVHPLAEIGNLPYLKNCESLLSTEPCPGPE